MKSPCVKDCQDRMPCGLCRKTCEKFLEYESERLKEKKMDVWNNYDCKKGDL